MNPRDKGRKYEREVADLFESYGFAVRGLEMHGDHIIIAAAKGVTLSSECKRQERFKITEWWAQTISDAPRGTVPVLTFRKSREESLSLIRTADLARLLGQ